MLHASEAEERRAKNIIWNAAGDYDFTPDFLSFTPEGAADLYLNCIIGAVHRYYDYRPLKDLFVRIGQLPDAALYEGLLWFGLAHSVYPAAKEDRPVLETLRLEYARDVVSHSRPYWDQELLERLQTAYCAGLLGQTARLRRREKRIMEAVLFSPSLDSRAIADQMDHILKEFFRCRLPELHEARSHRVLPFRLVIAALHGRPAFVTRVHSEEDGGGVHAPVTLTLPVLLARSGKQTLRSWLETNFGISVYTSQEQEELERMLCTEGHRSCHLHVTRGEYRRTSSKAQNSFRQAMLFQKERNLSFHHAHLADHMTAISRMTDQIRNVLLFDDGEQLYRARSGRLIAARVWRGIRLHDEKIFAGTTPCEKGNLSIDILLDASASQMDRQERIAAQGFIIAESLTRCRLPVRVCSYCSVNGCTVLRIFRDYENPQDNKRIFEYCSAGWNRDGLAIRITGYRLLNSGYENRLLIVLSDCSPNDDHRYSSRKGPIPFSYDYGGTHGIRDAAAEVSRLRRQNVSVLAVCTGHEKDLPAAREIYGNDVAWAGTEEQMADAVTYLIREKLRRL